MPEFKPASQFQQYVVDSFEAQTEVLEQVGKRCDAHESDIVDIDKEIECIQKERAVEKGKRKTVLWILGGVWTGLVIFLNWLIGK